MDKRDNPPEGSSEVVSGKPKRQRKIKKESPPIALEVFTPTFKQSKFIDEYIDNGGNATRAYAFAFGLVGDSARKAASTLLTNVDIRSLIEAKREYYASKLNYTREKHMKILVAIATAKKSDFLNINKDNQEQLAALGYDEYGLQCNSWDQKAARDELKAILGFDKPSNSNSGESIDGFLLEAAQKVIAGKQNE